MAIIVDANLAVVLVTKDPRGTVVEFQFEQWLNAGEVLHAPTLLRYEVANALTRLMVARQLLIDELDQAWAHFEQVPIRLHPLINGPEVIATALKLGRQNAYDAVYLVLARELGAPLWTLDGPLARNAIRLGFPIHLVQ